MRLFHGLYLSHLPTSSFLEGLSSEQFVELGSLRLLAFSARACSLAFLSSRYSFLAICRAIFVYLVVVFLFSFSLFSDSVDFSYSAGSVFLFFCDFSCVFYRAFLLSGSVLSSRGALSFENACSYSCVGDP